jgi:predicted ribosome quality control (RQC) complex YloA/Tae2 family protein
MNNYYTLIYLIREWKEKIIGSHFDVALSTRKNLLELHFEKDKESFRLIFSASPQNSALFLDRYQVPKRQNTASFFEVLQGEQLTDILLSEGDRLITFDFESGKQLIFQLYSNHANALLCENDQILEAFKKDKVLSGGHAPQPVPAAALKDVEIRKPSDVIAVVDPLLPRALVRGILAGIDLSTQQNLAIQLVHRLTSSLLTKAYPHYSEEYGFAIVRPDILGSKEVNAFDSVNEAVAYSFFRWVRFRDFETKRKSVSDRISKSIARTNIAISELSLTSNSDQKADEFERYGHLLMSVPYESTQSGILSTYDYFSDGESIEIKVDPLKSVVENAKVYYDKARSIRRASETYLKRLTEFKHKREDLQALFSQIESIKYGKELEKWLKSNEQALKKMGYAESETAQTAQHYRVYQNQGYEIRVGKSATSNDELLRISKKEDLWLHARGVSGSHVIIPLQKNQSIPARNVIEFAAGIAAFFSKAKGSSLVPVIFTRKKYVRKSKGMAPGAVFVEKEDVLLVAPFKPDELNFDD